MMKENIEKIDNVLITASIALLAAFVILYSAPTERNIFFSLSAILAVILLVLCLLLTLYAKYRESLRKSIFDSQTERFKSEFEKDLDKMMDEYYSPQLMELIKHALSKEQNKKAMIEDPKAITRILDAEKKQWETDKKSQHDYTRKLFAENHSLKIQKILENAYSGPLKEKNGILRYQIEVFSKKRYMLFVVGLIAFIVSVSTKLFL